MLKQKENVVKSNQKGFGAVGVVAVVVIVGLIVAVGWLVYDRQQTKTVNNETATPQVTEQTDNDSSEPTAQEPEYETIGNTKYSLPADWKNVKEPYEPYESGSGQYLLSPDYKEAGHGQLAIESGAYIHFNELEWAGIDSSTTLEQAVNVLKNSEGYLDTDSVKITKISGQQVVMFDSGHTTDGVTVHRKTSDNKWLVANFSTVNGSAGYDAQNSPHYGTFLSWLEQFLQLNQ